METSTFEKLNNVNVQGSTKQKNGLTYLPWSSAWKEVKKIDPEAKITIHEQIVDEYGTTRPWFTDGSGGAWVKVSVQILGKTETEWLPIMDFKNRAIGASEVTATDANKAAKRCLVKAIALHGLGLYLYEGEDLPEQDKKIRDLVMEVRTLLREKSGYGEEAKAKAIEYAKAAQKEAFPELDDEVLTGDVSQIEDEEILNALKIKVTSIRKAKPKTAAKG